MSLRLTAAQSTVGAGTIRLYQTLRQHPQESFLLLFFKKEEIIKIPSHLPQKINKLGLDKRRDF
jgi:hypothetical protein